MTGGKETMKHKYINASELIGMFRDDEMLSCDRPFDIYQWALNIIDECPPADGVVFLDILPGADIWTKDGKHGIVKSYNGGAKGIVRYIAELDGGEGELEAPAEEIGDSLSDAAAALSSLGYSQAEISSVLRRVKGTASTEEAVKFALKEFAGRK